MGAAPSLTRSAPTGLVCAHLCRADCATPLGGALHPGCATGLKGCLQIRDRNANIPTPPGSSNNRFRSWFASLSRSNLARSASLSFVAREAVQAVPPHWTGLGNGRMVKICLQIMGHS